MSEWWWGSFSDLGSAVAGAAALYVVLIAATRIAGLRAYSKMSGFDFPMTVAVGSLVASTILVPDPPLVRGAVILATVLLLQGFVAWLRSRSTTVRRVVDNQPLLLARDGRVIEENMARARVTLGELKEKLRESNVHHLREVQAVVLETTGDVAVIHGAPEEGIQPWIMEGVGGWDTTARESSPSP